MDSSKDPRWEVQKLHRRAFRHLSPCRHRPTLQPAAAGTFVLAFAAFASVATGTDAFGAVEVVGEAHVDSECLPLDCIL